MAEDTARRTNGIDLTHAVSLQPLVWAAGAVVVVLAAAVSAVALVPGSGDRLRRVATPWHRPDSAAFRIVVTSGEAVVRRGVPVTLTAYAEKTTPTATLPADAEIVFRTGPDAPETRLPMTGDGAGAFHFTRPNATADFEYRVAIGATTSDWFRVTVLDAVELADGTRAEIAPPAYATTRPTRTLAAFTDFDGLQFGTVTFQLKFTQPAAAAHLDWRPVGATASELLPVKIAPDRHSATAAFPLHQSGVLRLVLVREVGAKTLRTETMANVRVVHDAAPRFEELSGVTIRPRTAKPTDRVRIALTARDDLNITRAEVEYFVGSDATKSVAIPIPLTGAGTPLASGRFDFDLAGKASEGDTIRFRVRAFDNRRVDRGPKPLTPQAAVFPPSGWSELRLSATAPPLALQDIACQRDTLNDGITTARTVVAAAATEAGAIRADTVGHGTLALDHTVRLNTLRERIASAADTLREHARDAALTPELRPLATAVSTIIEKHLKVADDALRKAEGDESEQRKGSFDAAVQHLSAARDALGLLIDRNERLARARLDRELLGILAVDQTALADDAKAGVNGLRAQQRALLVRLEALLAESAPLRRAADTAKGAEARRLARTIAALGALLRDLDTAAKQTATDARTALIAAIARDQDAVGKRAAALMAKLDTAARLAGLAPLRPDDFRRVAALAAAGKTIEAVAELEKQALALVRIAEAFEKWEAARADPKFAAKQFALWQDDLLARFRAVTQVTTFDKLPDATKTRLRAEQKALHAAAVALVLPPDAAVHTAHAAVLIHTAKANEYLAGDGRGADDAMKAAAGALTQLAVKIPTAAERLTKSGAEFLKLRKQQEAIRVAVEQALKGYDRLPTDAPAFAALAKKLAPQLEKQRALAAAVAKLDLPGLGERQARLIAALTLATADLKAGLPFDATASQLRAWREFDYLKFVLDGITPADAQAADFHRRLIAVAAALDTAGPVLKPEQANAARQVVQDILKQFAMLAAPEAPALHHDVRLALQAADTGFRDGTTTAEIRRRIQTAADALGQLADRLDGSESDAARIRRLVGYRRRVTEKVRDVFADEAVRQLGREVDELTTTRVGPAGQKLKRRVLDLYARLRDKTNPDRAGTDQKALVKALDELAAKMADVAELNADRGRGVLPAPPAPADAFLPSKMLAGALRDLAKQQRVLHDQLTNLAAELSGEFRPAATNPFAAIHPKQRQLADEVRTLAKELTADKELAGQAAGAAALAADRLRVADVRAAKASADRATALLRRLAAASAGKPWTKRANELLQRQETLAGQVNGLLAAPNAAAAQQVARTRELAGQAVELAEVLDGVAKTFATDDVVGMAVSKAAQNARDAGKRLTEAAKSAAAGDTAEAAKLRGAADTLLRDAADTLTAAAPLAAPGANMATGVALRAAERAMRAALAGEPAAAEKAMHAAADALKAAGASGG